MNVHSTAQLGSDLAIPLYYWNYLPNFGDQISAPIVEWALQRPSRHVNAEHRGKLLAVGSILDVASDEDVVWGSGVHPTHYHVPSTRRLARFFRRRPSRPHILAVRGPITRDFLLSLNIECPAVFGDPALLLPRFFKPDARPRRELGVVAHYRDHAKLVAAGLPVIDVGGAWQDVVSEIAACSRVISTSLHGIIIAEAYGVPAVWLRIHSGEGFVKFADYYLSTGRAPQPAYSIEEAQGATAPPIALLDTEPLVNALRNHDFAGGWAR